MRASSDFLRVLCLAVISASVSAYGDKRPNIIVFYTDDHGYADLSCQDVFDDVRTPHVDSLAASGVRALHGYSTAPQCVPSRAGLLIGKFQSKFGVESNGYPMDGFNRENTIAQRLQSAGYVTAQFGKWHLGPGPKITDHGFRHVYNQNSQAPFYSNITRDGSDREMSVLRPEAYHVDACSEAAASIIHRYHDEPLFLYIAYRAPHVPLDAPKQYLDRFPGEMPQRRRQALAMLSAVDDGVGTVMNALKDHQLIENTLVFYIGDNGAPLKIHKLDAPGGGPGWDGSLNDPLNGEKGMLAEGGMHTPFVVSWPGTIPPGQQYPHPISALDVAATATAIANIKTNPGDLDGVNLVPFLSGEDDSAPHEYLMWRWISQSAIRGGDWKLLRGDDREYLYNLKNDLEEKHNVVDQYPEIASRLREELRTWCDGLSPPGFTTAPMSVTWNNYFDFYLDGKPVDPPRLPTSNRTSSKRSSSKRSDKSIWTVRSGTITKTADAWHVTAADRQAKPRPFITRNGINLSGPVDVTITIKTNQREPIIVSWRTKDESEFIPENQIAIPVSDSADFQTVTGSIPSDARIIHVRVQFASQTTVLRRCRFEPSSGQPIRLTE